MSVFGLGLGKSRIWTSLSETLLFGVWLIGQRHDQVLCLEMVILNKDECRFLGTWLNITCLIFDIKHTHVCMYVFIYIYMCVCMYAWVYICIYLSSSYLNLFFSTHNNIFTILTKKFLTFPLNPLLIHDYIENYIKYMECYMY